MSKAVEARNNGRVFGEASTSVISSTEATTATLSPVLGTGKRNLSIGSATNSPQKKASPSDVIFGKPPGTDAASQAYEALIADSTSGGSSMDSNASKGTIPEAETGGVGGGGDDKAESVGSSATGSFDSSDAPRQTSSSMPDTSSTSHGSQGAVDGGNMDDDDIKILPSLFEDADADDIVILVADMLTRLTAHNDLLPLHPTSLTRFHSRATPSITILSYLKRITKYTSLEKSCTLILLVYIDRVCQRISGFTICSLTVHRFICAAVVCASKALCDSFSTNGHYARVGGISLIELNMLEKEFLNIINWKLSCSGALLQHYYTSLVKSHESFQLEPSSVYQSQQQNHSQEQQQDLYQRQGQGAALLNNSDDVDMDR